MNSIESTHAQFSFASRDSLQIEIYFKIVNHCTFLSISFIRNKIYIYYLHHNRFLTQPETELCRLMRTNSSSTVLIIMMID